MRAVERDDRAAGVGGVQVRGRDVRQVDLPGGAHAGLGGARAGCLEVLEVEDHHVAAVAAVAGHVTARGGVGLGRRDDLEEAVAEREDVVLEAEGPHPGVAERLAQAAGLA
jgi:hypothetical protein